jgi:hypothetical protein
MSKLLIPNTCQVPNVLLDEIMPRIGGVALKVLLAIVRQTYGFGVPSRQIGLQKLSKLTGLSVQGVLNGTKELGGLIAVTRGPTNTRVSNEYALNIDVSTGQLLNEIDQSKDLSSQKIHNRLLKRVDSLKPNLKPNKKESTESDKPIPDSLSTKAKRKLTRPDPAVLAAFGPFYEAYPRHEGRQDALEAWLKLNPDAELIPVIMAAVERYAGEVRDTERKYILHPARWLNGKRWEDEPAHSDGNGQAKPVQVKDLGDGLVEIDGLKMTRETYERKYASRAV